MTNCLGEAGSTRQCDNDLTLQEIRSFLGSKNKEGISVRGNSISKGAPQIMRQWEWMGVRVIVFSQL